ncbi:MAG: ABC transporter permease [Lachnospiraceae bacterium]|nr:ABC transporter permease [Lachnospiraceae bacterium]
MEYLKSVFTKVYIRLLIAAGICIALGLVLVAVGVHSSSSLRDQQLTERWGDKAHFAQISVFFSELANFDANGAEEMKHSIEKELKEASLLSDSDEVRVWLGAYSANGKVLIASKHNSVDVKAVGVSGDYFQFHPLEIVSGSYFDSDYLMKDLVLLDEYTAFNLFGSNDIVGQVVEVGGKNHVVCGVYRNSETRLDKLAGNDEPTIYMSYEALANSGTISYINSYEALMPNPVSNFGFDIVKKCIKTDERRYEIIENSGRFKWTNLLKRVPQYGTRGMNSRGVIYPYWENMARGMEDYLLPLAVLGVLLFAYPIVLLVIVLIRMWKKRTIRGGDVKNLIENLIEGYREKRRKIKEGDFEVYEED